MKTRFTCLHSLVHLLPILQPNNRISVFVCYNYFFDSINSLVADGRSLRVALLLLSMTIWHTEQQKGGLLLTPTLRRHADQKGGGSSSWMVNPYCCDHQNIAAPSWCSLVWRICPNSMNVPFNFPDWSAGAESPIITDPLTPSSLYFITIIDPSQKGSTHIPWSCVCFV